MLQVFVCADNNNCFIIKFTPTSPTATVQVTNEYNLSSTSLCENVAMITFMTRIVDRFKQRQIERFNWYKRVVQIDP